MFELSTNRKMLLTKILKRRGRRTEFMQSKNRVYAEQRLCKVFVPNYDLSNI